MILVTYLTSLKMKREKIDFLIVFNIYCFFYYIILTYLLEKQSTPLVDEIFHIPQGLQYCHGNFSEWNPKITTLPGLYIVSFAVLRSAQFLSTSSLCNPVNLKFVNTVFALLGFCLLYSIVSLKAFAGKGLYHSRLALWTTVNISIFPVSFFFNFFYYSDTLSTFFFLLMYRLHVTNHFWYAAAIGFCDVLIRQTNIIWVGFLLLCLTHKIFDVIPKRKKQKSSNGLTGINIYWIFNHAWKDRKLRASVFQFLFDSAGYIIVCVVFVLFIFINKGIVVGDRNAHKPVLHMCQILYFSLFCLVFGFPHFFEKIKKFLLAINKNKKYWLAAVFLIGLVIHLFTMAHPYLLADNRHYTFYIWKRVYERHYLIKYLMILPYIFSIYCINSCLNKNIKFEYWLCSLLCLVPQKLLEFRYFLLPFILFRIQMTCKTWWHLAIESLLFMCINIASLYVFSTKEFYWNDFKDIQRIIW